MENEYIAPILTIDGIVFQLIDDKLCVLLIKRKREPFEGMYAIPGGYNPRGESTIEALTRILQVKAGVDVAEQEVTEQLYTFDAVGRDPRGHAVSVVYMTLGHNIVPIDSDTTEEPAFFPVTDLPKLAYDHNKIIKLAHDRLKSKVGYTNIVFSMIPKEFTLTQLQNAYEAILCHKLDKRNFRKKYLALGMLKDTKDTLREGAHRPAQLYRFKDQTLTNLSRDFA